MEQNYCSGLAREEGWEPAAASSIAFIVEGLSVTGLRVDPCGVAAGTA